MPKEEADSPARCGRADGAAAPGGGGELLAWLGDRDRRELVELAHLLSPDQPPVDLPLRAEEPTDLASLADLGATLESRMADWRRHLRRDQAPSRRAGAAGIRPAPARQL